MKYPMLKVITASMLEDYQYTRISAGTMRDNLQQVPDTRHNGNQQGSWQVHAESPRLNAAGGAVDNLDMFFDTVRGENSRFQVWICSRLLGDWLFLCNHHVPPLPRLI